ncbi:MAG: MFS transporter [Clostridiales bacterium]|nr:MFS transporter [Clostridiales bacterium]
MKNIVNSFAEIKEYMKLWVGQTVSLVGTRMTAFAIMIWIWGEYDSAIPVTNFAFFVAAAVVLVSPFAGVLVDNNNKKFVMAVSDVISGVASIGLLILIHLGILDLWHLYVYATVTGAVGAFQMPAFMAAIPIIVPKEHLPRVGGLMAISKMASRIAAPLLGAVVIRIFDFSTILWIDVVTFIFAIILLIATRIPEDVKKKAITDKLGMFDDMKKGFVYIIKNNSLFAILIMFLIVNSITAVAATLMNPLVLARTQNNEVALAIVLAVAAVGGILAGMYMASVKADFKKMHVMLVSIFLLGLGVFLMGTGQNVIIISIGAFTMFFFAVIASVSNTSFVQTKVRRDMLGRYFSASNMIVQLAIPILMIISGPLVEYYFNIGIVNPNSFLYNLQWIVGSGEGGGIGLMFTSIGVITAIVAVVSYFIKHIRDAEDVMVDATE